MSEVMTSTVAVPLPTVLADWLAAESARQDRPKAYIARKALERERAAQSQQRTAA